MTWQAVPWMIGNGAVHSEEVMRLLAYVAFNGNEGILGPEDLRVSAYTTPGAGVNIAPGACAVLTRGTAVTYQAYAARNPTQDTVNIAATGTGAGRSDLIVARVEDPNISGSPWNQPANIAAGPYMFTRVISGVPATTTDVKQLNLGYSAITLARVTLPASTATVTQAMITDLRRVANPRRELIVDHRQSTTDDTLNPAVSAYEQFPNGVWFNVDIPTWAVQAKCSGFVEGLRLTKAGIGALRIGFSGGGGATQATNINEAQFIGGNYDRRSYALGGVIPIPSAWRGTTKVIQIEGTIGNTGSSAFLATDAYSSGSIQVYFEEKAV